MFHTLAASTSSEPNDIEHLYYLAVFIGLLSNLSLIALYFKASSGTSPDSNRL